MKDLIINVGVYTPIEVDLSTYDFTGIEKVVFTIKNDVEDETPIVEREFTEPKKYIIDVTTEEREKLEANAKYDFIKITIDGIPYKETKTGKIKLEYAVGDGDE